MKRVVLALMVFLVPGVGEAQTWQDAAIQCQTDYTNLLYACNDMNSKWSVAYNAEKKRADDNYSAVVASMTRTDQCLNMLGNCDAAYNSYKATNEEQAKLIRRLKKQLKARGR